MKIFNFWKFFQKTREKNVQNFSNFLIFGHFPPYFSKEALWPPLFLKFATFFENLVFAVEIRRKIGFWRLDMIFYAARREKLNAPIFSSFRAIFKAVERFWAKKIFIVKFKIRTCLTHVFFTIFGIFFYKEKIWRKKFFYKEKFQFPPYFRKFSKVDEIHVFSKFSKNRDFARLKAQPLFNIF